MCGINRIYAYHFYASNPVTGLNPNGPGMTLSLLTSVVKRFKVVCGVGLDEAALANQTQDSSRFLARGYNDDGR
jgi:hypothetical protein